MITLEQIRKYLRSLLAKTASKVEESQKSIVPIILHTDMGVNHSITGKHETLSVIPVERYRYDSKWYQYKYSAIDTNQTFGILKIDNVFTTNQLNKITEKQFIGTVNTLVHESLIKPFILILDGKIVPWNVLEFIYDCGDTWLLLRGEKYNYFNLKNIKKVSLILWPFKLEYIGKEEEYLFLNRYNALSDYIQNNSKVKNGNFYIMSPNLYTQWTYNGDVYNVGGWLYEQMKLYKLGLLTDDQIYSLRNINISKITYDSYGEILTYDTTKYNALDSDIPTDAEAYNYVYGTTKEEYEAKYKKIAFNENGEFTTNGELAFYIVDDSVISQYIHIDNTYIWDLSDIKSLLFRENFLIFVNGEYNENFEILSSINNMTLIPNPDNNSIDVLLIYSKYAEHVISNADKFKTNYMNLHARNHFEALINGTDNSHLPNSNSDLYEEPKYIDAYVPDEINTEYIYTNINTDSSLDVIESEDHHRPKEPGYLASLNTDIGNNKIYDYDNLNSIHAQTEPDNRLIRNISMYVLKEEAQKMPKILDYVVFINKITQSQEEALDIISRVVDPLEFIIDNSLTIDENLDNNLETVINYDVSLLNGLIHTSVDSYYIDGKKANEALIHTFMYEYRRGLKIPRKAYDNHETYFMIFVNGELFSEYYRTIVYANFFFIPIKNDFYFNDGDKIEIVYYKNVNNNEIRFALTDWLLEQFTDNKYDASYFNANIFNKWIDDDELKVFCHYPKEMLVYKDLIPEATENIAFNISYRDSDNQLCIKKSGLTHILRDHINDYIKSITNEDAPEELRDSLENIDVDSYMNSIKNNTYILEKGINLLSKDKNLIQNALVACSSHKFVYQRLFVHYRSYRIKLDKRFRYCDNPKQYLLFINGRRQRQDSFLVTIPKHTRPFNDLYLYTAVFVGADDRVELFYLPYEMTDINFPEDRRYELRSDGYLELPKDILNVPFSRDLYMIFINGKKIPSAFIKDVDSNTIRLAIDTNTLHYPMITAINTDNLSSIEEYMKDAARESKYDELIHYVKNRSNGISLLDRMLGIFTQISDFESDKLWMNVAKIAILNEIIRDFWVSRGFDYHNKEILYDYDKDDYFTYLEDGTLILPSLDASPDINIIKDDISLLYFYTDPMNLMCEYGNIMDKLIFYWEYSRRLNSPWNILSQSINGIDIGTEARSWETNPRETGVEHYRFIANTGQHYIVKDLDIGYVNGTYWGTIDYRALEYYEYIHKYQYMDELVAVIPNNKIMPSREQLELESGNILYKAYIEDHYTIIHGLTYQDMLEQEIDIWADPRLTNIYNENFIAICEDGRILNKIRTKTYRDDLIIKSDVYIFSIEPDIQLLNNIYNEYTPNIIYEDHNIVEQSFIAIANYSNNYRFINPFVIIDNLPGYFNDDRLYNIENMNEIISIDDNTDIISRDLSYNKMDLLYSEPEYDYNNDIFMLEHDEFFAIVSTENMLKDEPIEDYYYRDLETGELYLPDEDDILISSKITEIMWYNSIDRLYHITSDLNIISQYEKEYNQVIALSGINRMSDLDILVVFDLTYEALDMSKDLIEFYDININSTTFIALLDPTEEEMQRITFAIDLDNQEIMTLYNDDGNLEFIDLYDDNVYNAREITYKFDDIINNQELDYFIAKDLDTGESYELNLNDGTYTIKDSDNNIISNIYINEIDETQVYNIMRNIYADSIFKIIRRYDGKKVAITDILSVYNDLIVKDLIYKPLIDSIKLKQVHTKGGQLEYELISGYNDADTYIINNDSFCSITGDIAFQLSALSYKDLDTMMDLEFSMESLVTNEYDINEIIYQYIDSNNDSSFDDNTVPLMSDDNTLRNLTDDPYFIKYYRERKDRSNIIPLMSDLTYEIIDKISKIESLDILNISHDSFMASVNTVGNDVNELDLLSLDSLTELYLTNGLIYKDIDNNSYIEDLTFYDIGLIEQALRDGVNLLDIINGTTNYNIDDLYTFGFNVRTEFLNKITTDDNFKERARKFINILTSIDGIYGIDSENNLIEDLTYTSIVKTAYIGEKKITDEFGNILYIVYNDYYDYAIDLSTGEYLYDLNYLVDNKTYSEDDFESGYDINSYRQIEEELINSNAILLSSTIGYDEDNNSIENIIPYITSDIYDRHIFDLIDKDINSLDSDRVVLDTSYNLLSYIEQYIFIDEFNMNKNNYDYIVAIYDIYNDVNTFIDFNLGLEDIQLYDLETYETYYNEINNTLLAYDISTEEIINDILIYNINGNNIIENLDSTFEISIIEPIQMKYTILKDDEITLSLNGFCILDDNGNITNTYNLIYKNSKQDSLNILYDVTYDNFMAIIDDNNIIYNISIEEYNKTYQISIDDGIVIYNIDNNNIWLYIDGNILDERIHFSTIEIWNNIEIENYKKYEFLIDITYNDEYILVNTSEYEIYTITKNDEYKIYNIDTSNIKADNIYTFRPLIKIINELLDPLDDNFIALYDNGFFNNLSLQDNVYGYEITKNSNIAIDITSLIDNIIYIDPSHIYYEDYDIYNDLFYAIPNDGSDLIYNLYHIIDSHRLTKYSLEIALMSMSGFKIMNNKNDEEYNMSEVYPYNILWKEYEWLLKHYGIFDLMNNIDDIYIISNIDGSIDNTNIDYIYKNLSEPEDPKMNFYNIDKFGYPNAYSDDNELLYTDVSYIELNKPEWKYDKNIIEVLEYNEYDTIKIISHSNDINGDDYIYSDYLYAISNSYSNIINMVYYNINTSGTSIIISLDNDTVSLNHTEDLILTANNESVRQYIGFYNLSDDNNMLSAILDGSAKIINSVDYQIDSYTDNYDIILYELNDDIYAYTLDGQYITNLDYKKYEDTWTQIGVTNLADSNIIAINESDNTRYDSITYVYDMNNPSIRYFFNEEDLPTMIQIIDKYLIPEPPYITIKDYKIDNFNYFIFACPKRLVYNGYHSMVTFIMPDPNSDDIKSHSVDSTSIPLYTNGKKNNVYQKLDQMNMDYLGECEFINNYGYKEMYMVWKSNGYFTRLYDNYGIDITIKIGVTNNNPILFYNTTQYYDGLNSSEEVTHYFKESDFDSYYNITTSTSSSANMSGILTDPYIAGYISNINKRTDLTPEYSRYITYSEGLFSQSITI